jgi:predicted kinase
MGTVELKSNLHQIVDRINDERLLRAIFSFLKERENSGESRIWDALTEEQRKEVLRAFDESEDEINLIEDKDVWKKVK